MTGARERRIGLPGGPLYEVVPVFTICGLLERAALADPGKTALMDLGDATGSGVTYASLARSVDLIAAGLVRSIGGQRPVVALVGSNSVRWAKAYFAILRAGGTVVPMDRELPAGELEAIVHYSGANAVFFDPEHEEGFVELASRLKAGPLLVRLVRGNGGVAGAGPVPMEELEAIGRGRPLPDPPGPEDIAAICYTSGTMGRAKGVVLTHSNICSVINQMLRLVDLRRDDVFLSVLPVHHTYECTCGLLAPMHMQATVAFCRGLRHVAEDLAGSGATVMLGVPLLWESMYRRVIDGIKGRRGGALRLAFGTAASRVLGLFGREGDRRRLLAPLHRRLGGRVRLFVSGGAAQDPLVSRGFRDLGFDFIQGYGLTEASPLIAVNRETAFRDSSVGLPLPDMDVRIDDPDGEGNGEIVVRGPNVMVGYHEDPEETRAVLRDGWLHTGDLGHFDRDGFLYVTGRKKNVIIAKNGKNVYPEELEVVLTRSALISEAMVFGRQSASKGEEIAAVVVADTEALIGALESSGRRLSREIAAELLRGEIRSFNQSQPAFKRIASFVIFEGELPRTTTRKIRRRDVLREVGLAPGESFGV